MPSYVEDNRRIETIGGRRHILPFQSSTANLVTGNILMVFANYLKGKPGKVYMRFQVVFSENDKVFPDIVVVCDKSKVKEYHIEAPPDLVVEVISPATYAVDRIDKARLYERHGVKEYWIVDSENHAIEVFLHDGERLRNAGVYADIPRWEIEDIIGAGGNSYVYEFSPSMFSDLVIHVDDVFQELTED